MIASLKLFSRAGLTACLCALSLAGPTLAQEKGAPAMSTPVPAASSPAASSPGAGDASALPGGAGPKVTAEMSIRRLLEARVGTKVEDFGRSPFPGLYEARIGDDRMVYTDDKVNYIFVGDMLDGKSGRNLTQRRLDQLTAINFDSLPLKDAIKVVNGTGKTRIAYFSDPNCPYCKRYEKTLSEMKDVTVYVFLVGILGDDSVAKAKVLWCAPDRAKAWSDWMLRERMPAARGCETPLESNLALARSLNMRGTPFTVLPDGVKMSGAATREQLQQALAQAAP